VESSWIASFDADLRSNGARVAGIGYVDTQDLEAALS
jgi:hypothetical protein